MIPDLFLALASLALLLSPVLLDAGRNLLFHKQMEREERRAQGTRQLPYGSLQAR
jgi:hypothetical protein